MPISDPIFTSTALQYAADNAYDVQGDAYDSSLVKVEPPLGFIEQGLRPKRQIAAQHFNWVMGQFALIMQGLISNDGLHEADIDAIELVNATQDGRLDDLEDYSPRIRIYPFMASTTFQPSTRVLFALGVGCGGGGGGGKGMNGVETEDRWAAGAGAGGGSELIWMPLSGLDPALTYNVDIGAGGLGATVASASGGDGGDTVLRLGSTQLMVCPGAQGGRGAVGGQMIQYWVGYTLGGVSRKGMPIMTLGGVGRGIRFDTATSGSALGPTYGSVTSGGPHSLMIPLSPGQGGFGAGGSPNPGASNAASQGAPNKVGTFAGGSPGSQGGDFGTARGGGGGGGGGAGPFGPGGNGGGGAQGGIFQGTFPSAGAANSGAGGGGSGSVGYSPTGTPVLPRNGADGGSGRYYIITVEETGP